MGIPFPHALGCCTFIQMCGLAPIKNSRNVMPRHHGKYQSEEGMIKT